MDINNIRKFPNNGLNHIKNILFSLLTPRDLYTHYFDSHSEHEITPLIPDTNIASLMQDQSCITIYVMYSVMSLIGFLLTDYLCKNMLVIIIISDEGQICLFTFHLKTK